MNCHDDRPKPASFMWPWQSDTRRPLRIASRRIGGALVHIGRPEVGGAPPAIGHLEQRGAVFCLAAQARFGWVCLWPRFYLHWSLFVVLSATPLRAGHDSRRLDSTGPPNASLWAPAWWRFLHCGHTEPAGPPPKRARARAHLWTCTPNRVRRQRARASAPTPRFGTVLAAFCLSHFRARAGAARPL